MSIFVDHTHLGRHVTGLERITLELFSPQALAPLPIVPVTANGTLAMMAMQSFGLAARLVASPRAILLCPGFPPSPLLWPFRRRVLPYIHDVFLLTRRQDLNARAKLYMAAPFARAVRGYPCFLANSEDTSRKLSAHCRPDAEITLYRPQVRNVFGLRDTGRAQRQPRPAPLRLIAMGTVEPRKNLLAAARIVAVLTAIGCPATLDIVGRRGWGEDWDQLSRRPGVTLHGYQPAERVQALFEAADALICTSHEEGLGLPLLEAQFGGMPVIAPDQPVFREVLGLSGILINPANTKAAADHIAAAFTAASWRARHANLAARNLQRWNALAAADRDTVIDLMARMAGVTGPLPKPQRPRQAA